MHKNPKMSVNKVVILRHGESDFGMQNIFCGWHDSPLTEKGRKDASQIAAAGLRSRNLTFDFIYTSMLERAQETADIIVKELNYTNAQIIKDWRLNERHYGNLTGFNKRQMANKYTEEQIQTWRRSFDIPPPDITSDNPFYHTISANENLSVVPPEQFPLAESLKTLMLRTIPVWENEIMPKILNGEKILIVTHGTVARSLIKHIEGISDKDIMNINVPNVIPFVYQFNVNTGQRVGEMEYLADNDFVKSETAKVAAIGN